MKTERVALLGASDKPDRYAYLALRLLGEQGHEVLPVLEALHPGASRRLSGLSSRLADEQDSHEQLEQLPHRVLKKQKHQQ